MDARTHAQRIEQKRKYEHERRRHVTEAISTLKRSLLRAGVHPWNLRTQLDVINEAIRHIGESIRSGESRYPVSRPQVSVFHVDTIFVSCSSPPRNHTCSYVIYRTRISVNLRISGHVWKRKQRQRQSTWTFRSSRRRPVRRTMPTCLPWTIRLIIAFLKHGYRHLIPCRTPTLDLCCCCRLLHIG